MGDPSEGSRPERYHLQARRIAGPLCALTCNDSRFEDSDHLSSVLARVRALLLDGFTVWLYERLVTDSASSSATLHCVAIYDPPAPGETVGVMPSARPQATRPRRGATRGVGRARALRGHR